ncbi:hypothetical protein AB0N23_32305, partial [Streptomyces sp. NPDC052644]
MGHSSVRGEGTRDGVPHARSARDTGWDDSLDTAGQADARSGGHGAAGAHDGTDGGTGRGAGAASGT